METLLYEKVRSIKPTESLSVSSIFRVPMNMRREDKPHTYQPVIVSIGPFHHKSDKLALQKPMQDCKVAFFEALMTRKCPKDDNISTTQCFEDLVSQMQKLETSARGCYSETFPGISSEDFVCMMILDGCFIIELFYLHRYGGKKSGFESMNEKMKLKSRWMLWEVVMDLLMLENQLPWLVLQQLYEFFFSADRRFTLYGLSANFLSRCLPQLSLSKNIPYNHIPDLDFHHLLALEHHLLEIQNDSVSIDIDETSQQYEPPREKCALPSINDLLFSGISLKTKTTDGGGDRAVITSIEYNVKRSKLEIPALTVDKSTTVLLRNLVAYEQCNIEVTPVVTSYVTFVDALVNSPADVEALRIRGILHHFLRNNEEVSELFNHLTSGIDYNLNGSNYLVSVRSQIQLHYNSKWPQRKVLWRRLMNTHEGITYLVTIVALYLTVLQTIFTLLSYFLPRN